MAASIKCDERPFKGGVWGGFAPPAKNWGVWGAAPPSQNFRRSIILNIANLHFNLLRESIKMEFDNLILHDIVNVLADTEVELIHSLTAFRSTFLI